MLKQVLFISLLFSFSLGLDAQNQSIKKFSQDQKNEQGIEVVALPGWLVKLGIGLAGEDFETENPALKEAAKRLRYIRVLSIDNPTEAHQASAQSIALVAKEKDYKDFGFIREDGAAINIMLRDKLVKNGKVQLVKGLIIMVNDSDELILVSLKGRWYMKEILPYLSNKDFDFNFDRKDFSLLKKA